MTDFPLDDEAVAACANSYSIPVEVVQELIPAYFAAAGFKVSTGGMQPLRRAGEPLRITRVVYGPNEAIKPLRRYDDDPNDTSEYIHGEYGEPGTRTQNGP